MAVKKYGFSSCQAYHTLFVKHSLGGRIIVFIVYVDDIILIGDDEKEKDGLKKFIAKEFKTKDLGLFKYFFGMEVA